MPASAIFLKVRVYWMPRQSLSPAWPKGRTRWRGTTPDSGGLYPHYRQALFTAAGFSRLSS
jgi:hypothetical protein